MKEVGIFEAKTHFTQLCEQVARGGDPIIISKRGRPMVVLQRANAVGSGNRLDILAAWENWQREHPEPESEFPQVWQHRKSLNRDPLAE